MTTFSTQDIAFASFLVQNGLTIQNVLRRGRRVTWEFAADELTLEKLEAMWPSSEAARFFTTYQTLKGQLRKS